MQTGLENSPLAKISQIGIVVRDANKAAQFYQSLGLGPFSPLQGAKVIERMQYGKPANDIKIDIRIGQIGPLQVELLQPLSGQSLWKEFLETKGEGINHLGFFVDDLDEAVAKLEKQGLKMVYRSRFDNGGGAAYFDAREIGGLFFELIQWQPKTRS